MRISPLGLQLRLAAVRTSRRRDTSTGPMILSALLPRAALKMRRGASRSGSHAHEQELVINLRRITVSQRPPDAQRGVAQPVDRQRV